jgi:plastocyanin
MARRLLLVLALLAALSLTVACSSGDDDDDGGDDGGNGTATTEPTDDGGNGGGDVAFDISMTDTDYAPSELTVPTGSTVTLNLTNDGAAIHNLRIAGADNDYDTDDDAVSDPDLVAAGEVATVEWVAPDEAGVIDFRCDFHPDLGGTITVE